MISFKLWYFLVPIFFTGYFSCGESGKESDKTYTVSARQDSINTSIVINYLRENFDDIHDVSMRFHHLDHTLNGLIVVRLNWHNGRLESGEVLQNETGNANFAEALIEKMYNWVIPDLKNIFEMNLPLRIRIVGSDDSSFSIKSILTGEVVDKNGDPIKNAKLHFIPVSNSKDTVASCYTNREGVYVRPLIPPGTWNVVCSCAGFENVYMNNLIFLPGEHHRQKITMKMN